MALRQMYRTREGRTNPKYKGNDANDISTEYEQYMPAYKTNQPKTAITISNIIPTTGTPRRVLFDDDKPEPTGFHSDLHITKWLEKYCIRMFHGQLYQVQYDIHEFQAKYPWNMTKVYRAAGKTVLTLGKLAYKICENPEERLFILGQEIKKTIQRVRVVRNLLGSEEIVNDYGYLINDAGSGNRRRGKNTEAMFEVHREIDAIEPTLMAITWKDDQALGYHYTGGTMDDPWSKKLQNQEDAKEKWMEWWGEFQGSLEGCRFLDILCTAKGMKDLYARLEGEKQFKVLKIPLVLKFPSKTKLLMNEAEDLYIGAEVSDDYEFYDDCNGKYSMTTLDYKRGIKCIPILRHNDPLNFEMEYQQNPYLPEGNVFKWKYANIFNSHTPDPIVMGFYKQFGAVKKIKMMDMAFGESKKSALNVMLMMGIYRRRLFIFDAWVGRWSTSERIKVIKKSEAKYPGVPLYIEDDVSQIATVRDIKKQLKHLKIRNFTSKGKGQNYRVIYEGEQDASKKGKIHDSLGVPWTDGRFYIYKDLPYFDELKFQLLQFPKCEMFDLIDAMAMGTIVLRDFAIESVIAVNRLY